MTAADSTAGGPSCGGSSGLPIRRIRFMASELRTAVFKAVSSSNCCRRIQWARPRTLDVPKPATKPDARCRFPVRRNAQGNFTDSQCPSGGIDEAGHCGLPLSSTLLALCLPSNLMNRHHKPRLESTERRGGGEKREPQGRADLCRARAAPGFKCHACTIG